MKFQFSRKFGDEMPHSGVLGEHCFDSLSDFDCLITGNSRFTSKFQEEIGPNVSQKILPKLALISNFGD